MADRKKDVYTVFKNGQAIVREKNSINFKRKVCCDARDSDNKEQYRERLISTSYPLFHHQRSIHDKSKRAAHVSSQGRRCRRFHFSQPGKSAIRWGPAQDVIKEQRERSGEQNEATNKHQKQVAVCGRYRHCSRLGLLQSHTSQKKEGHSDARYIFNCLILCSELIFLSLWDHKIEPNVWLTTQNLQNPLPHCLLYSLPPPKRCACLYCSSS